jgi:hypothetical protein
MPSSSTDKFEKADVVAFFENAGGNCVFWLIQVKDWFLEQIWDNNKGKLIPKIEAWKKHDPFPEPLEITLDNGKKVLAIPFNLLISSSELDKNELDIQLKQLGLKSCDGIGSTVEMQN